MKRIIRCILAGTLFSAALAAFSPAPAAAEGFVVGYADIRHIMAASKRLKSLHVEHNAAVGRLNELGRCSVQDVFVESIVVCLPPTPRGVTTGKKEFVGTFHSMLNAAKARVNDLNGKLQKADRDIRDLAARLAKQKGMAMIFFDRSQHFRLLRYADITAEVLEKFDE